MVSGKSMRHLLRRNPRWLLALQFRVAVQLKMDFPRVKERLAAEVPKALCFLKDVGDLVSGVDASLSALTLKVENGELDTTKGLSLLELKCHLMLNYLTDVSVVLMKKCGGERICGDASVERLVECRTVLEKVRPIEQKLKYHVDKLIRVASGVIGSKDPISFRANPQNLVSKLDDGEEEEEEEGGRGDVKEKSGREAPTKAYVPPKLASVPYDGDLQDARRTTENARKRALGTSVMRELRAEYHDGPQEIVDTAYSERRKESHEAKSRREYEEEYMVRLNVSKREKAMERKRATLSGLEGLTHFGDISALTGRGDDFKGPRKRSRPDGRLKGRKSKKRKWK